MADITGQSHPLVICIQQVNCSPLMFFCYLICKNWDIAKMSPFCWNLVCQSWVWNKMFHPPNHLHKIKKWGYASKHLDWQCRSLLHAILTFYICFHLHPSVYDDDDRMNVFPAAEHQPAVLFHLIMNVVQFTSH